MSDTYAEVTIVGRKRLTYKNIFEKSLLPHEKAGSTKRGQYQSSPITAFPAGDNRNRDGEALSTQSTVPIRRENRFPRGGQSKSGRRSAIYPVDSTNPAGEASSTQSTALIRADWRCRPNRDPRSLSQDLREKGFCLPGKIYLPL